MCESLCFDARKVALVKTLESLFKARSSLTPAQIVEAILGDTSDAPALGLTITASLACSADVLARVNSRVTGYRASINVPTAHTDPAASLKQIEERIERAVLSKLPSKFPEPMEVDSASESSGYDHRIEELEAQMKRLSNSHLHLENKVDEAQRRNDAQFTQLQNQVSSQIDMQSSRIEDLFKGQLAQIESLLGKRARTE